MASKTSTDSKQLALKMGLDGEEWELACEILGRLPSEAELYLYSALWSEDISSKSTVSLLKTLYRGEEQEKGTRLGISGVVDLDADNVVAARMMGCETWLHKFPEVAIRQDIERGLAELYSIGVMPSAVIHHICLGYPENVLNQELLKKLSAASAEYCHSINLPCIDFGLYFNAAFDRGAVVNTCVVGIANYSLSELPKKAVIGDTVYYVGEKTGEVKNKKEDAEEESNLVQMFKRNGNPVLALRIGAALCEGIQAGLIRSMVWLGKGGIAAGSFKLAATVGRPLKLELDKVPAASTDVPLEELLLSEAPRRALFVSSRNNYSRFSSILEKWGVKEAQVGEVVDGDGLQFSTAHKTIADIPLQKTLETAVRKSYQLVDFPPMLKKSSKIRASLSSELKAGLDSEGDNSQIAVPNKPDYLEDVWLDMLGSPNFCSRKPLFESFDTRVGNRLFPGNYDARLLKLFLPMEQIGTSALALTAVSKPLYITEDSYLGSVHCIAEGMRNLASVGARPLAVINCIDAGNPAKYKDLCNVAECVRGLNDACQYWDIPILSDFMKVAAGADSLVTISTPTILMLGRSVAPSVLPKIEFQDAGDVIFIIGATKEDISCSEYAHYANQSIGVEAPDIDFENERKVCEAIVNIVDRGVLKSLHRVSSGGLGVAFAECCLSSAVPIGAKVDIKAEVTKGRDDFVIFSESPGRFILSVAPAEKANIQKYFSEQGVAITGIGEVGGKTISFDGDANVEISLTTAYKVWSSRLADILAEEKTPLQLLSLC